MIVCSPCLLSVILISVVGGLWMIDHTLSFSPPLPQSKSFFYAASLKKSVSVTFTTPSHSLSSSFSPFASKHPKQKPSSLFLAGFGGAEKNKNKSNKKSKLPKLKAKAQWDRYCDKLKGAKSYVVGVRVVARDSEDYIGEWLEVGRVKSENEEDTEMSVAVQRGLIAEHAKRLLPLKILPKDKVEWGYIPNGEEWVLLNKSVSDGAPSGFEKKIGFEGIPDTATGFYCHYADGRLVDKNLGSDRKEINKAFKN